MKKSDLVNIILQTPPVSTGRDLPPRGLVSRIIGMALNNIFFKIFAKEPSFMADYMKPFSLVPVRHDQNISIITIPVSTLQFAEIGDMVRISYQSEPDLLFVPVRINEIDLIEEIQEIDSVCPFVVKGDKIWIYGLTSVSPLLVEVIQSFESLSDDTDIKIPSGADAELINTVRAMLGYAN